MAAAACLNRLIGRATDSSPMVKKRSLATTTTDRERRVDEDLLVVGEDQPQESTVTKDVHSGEILGNLEVMSFASEEQLPFKCTRSRLQNSVSVKEARIVSESEALPGDSDFRFPDGVRCQLPLTVHQIATRSATGRLVKRPKKDLAIQKSPPRKHVKEIQVPHADAANPESARPRRAWELWSTEDKNLFFEALFEHGKDFDAIQNFMAQRHRKRGGTDSAAKTKDQIRHFYYRTCHKIASYIDLPTTDDIKKQIYSLVCYGELRRKGLLKMNKIGPKLNELLTQGNTVIRIRGKNLRIKIPTCRALKRLHNVDDQRDESKLKLPEKIVLKLHPRTNKAWSHVQMLSQNPRLLINVQPDQHLSAIIDYLSKKWRLECLQMREALGEKVVDPLELQLHVSPDCSLTPITINRSISQSKLDFSFGCFRESVKSIGAATSTTVSPPNKRTVKITSSRNEDLPLAKDLTVTDSAKVVGVSSASKAVEEEKLAIAASLSSSFSEPVQPLETFFNGRVSSETEENACDAVCSEFDCPESSGQRENADLCTEFSASDACVQSDGSTLTVVTQDCGIASASSSLTSVAPLASVGQVTTSVHLVTNSTSMASAPSNSVLVEKLLGPIDRTLAEEVTMAEIFIMAGRPKELTLEYEWVGKSLDSCASGVSALQHLANIALAEYSSFNRISSSGRLGAMSPPSVIAGAKPDMNSSVAKTFARSPRVRQTQGVSRLRKESISTAPDASLDQSANYPWPNASTLVSSFNSVNLLTAVGLAPQYTFSPPSFSSLSATSMPVTTVTYSGTAMTGSCNSPKAPATTTSECVFRIPKSLPPKLQQKNGDNRTIVDKTVLDGLSIYSSKRSDQFMPRKVRTRNTRKPLVVQRTLLPKSQLQTSQIVTLTLVPGMSNAQTGSFLPVTCSTGSTPQSTAPLVLETVNSTLESGDSQQNVIKMAPTELKSTGIRRIVPVPVPADPVTIFPQENNVTSSRNAVSLSVNEAVHIPASGSSEPSLPMAITGIDAFLQSSESQDSIPVQQGSSQPLAPSFIQSLGDSNLSLPSLLDMPLSEGADSNDRFLDLELMNSNSSFTGLLNTIEEKNPPTVLALSNEDSLLNPVKNFQGLSSCEEAAPWLNNEELSLSSILPNFLLVKKDFDRSLTSLSLVSLATKPTTINQGFISESSRESNSLGNFGTVDGALQSLLNENSMDIASRFNDMFRPVDQTSALEQNLSLKAVASEASDCGFGSNL